MPAPKHVTLREYLESLEKPDPLSRSRRADPGTFCGKCPTPSFPNAEAKCKSGRWKPDYVTQEDGCDCLSEYKCCNDSCQPVDVKACWEGGMKGAEYGILEKDCCDCPVVKCLPCNSTTPEDEMCPRGAGARPKDCYNYKKHDSYSKDDRKCWLSHCTAKSSDAQNQTCLKDCQREVERTSHCQFPEIECKNTQLVADCPNNDLASAMAKLPKPTLCYDNAVKGDDDASGHYYDSNNQRCKKCQKWTVPLKSCKIKNDAADKEDCHEYGEHAMDKKCFEKSITRDDCDCEVAQCAYTSKPEPEVFKPKEVCPKNHVKKSGVTICMKKRDVCINCPLYIPIPNTDCPNGKVIKEKDSNGCDVSKCERATVPSEDCFCKNYKLDMETNTLTCNCEQYPAYGKLILRNERYSGVSSVDMLNPSKVENNPRVKTGPGYGFDTLATSMQGGWIDQDFMTNWEKKMIEEKKTKVRFTFWKRVSSKASPVVDIIFNYKSSRYDWFGQQNIDRIVHGPTALRNCDQYNFWRATGDPRYARSFFVNRGYGGCQNDNGFIVVSDKIDPCHKTWMGGKGWESFPRFLYSRVRGCKWSNVGNCVQEADALTISVL